MFKWFLEGWKDAPLAYKLGISLALICLVAFVSLCASTAGIIPLTWVPALGWLALATFLSAGLLFYLLQFQPDLIENLTLNDLKKINLTAIMNFFKIRWYAIEIYATLHLNGRAIAYYFQNTWLVWATVLISLLYTWLQWVVYTIVKGDLGSKIFLISLLWATILIFFIFQVTKHTLSTRIIHACVMGISIGAILPHLALLPFSNRLIIVPSILPIAWIIYLGYKLGWWHSFMEFLKDLAEINKDI